MRTLITWLGLFACLGCGRVSYELIAGDGGSGGDGADAGDDSFSVTCSDPAPALAVAPPLAEREPSLYVDGLTLVIREVGTPLRQAVRPDPLSAFGPPQVVTVIRDSVEDPTFIELDGEVHAFASSGMAPRRFLSCPNPGPGISCDVATLFVAGVPIADDHDGPTVAIIDGRVAVAISRGDELYLAVPRDSTFTEWDAELIDVGGDTDDAALTCDGRLLLAFIESGPDAGLVAMRWSSAQARFVDPTPVPLPVGFSSPEVGIDTGANFELFLSGDGRGVTEPYLATCTTTVLP